MPDAEWSAVLALCRALACFPWWSLHVVPVCDNAALAWAPWVACGALRDHGLRAPAPVFSGCGSHLQAEAQTKTRHDGRDVPQRLPQARSSDCRSASSRSRMYPLIAAKVEGKPALLESPIHVPIAFPAPSADQINSASCSTRPGPRHASVRFSRLARARRSIRPQIPLLSPEELLPAVAGVEHFAKIYSRSSVTRLCRTYRCGAQTAGSRRNNPLGLWQRPFPAKHPRTADLRHTTELPLYDSRLSTATVAPALP